MKFKKNYDDTLFNEELIQQICYEFNIEPKIVKFIYSNGYSSYEKITDFLQPSTKQFYDPYLLNGMSDAVERLRQAISKKESILIFGDYDTDGIGATSILYLYLKNLGVNCRYFIPNRFEDGYGLTIGALEKIFLIEKPDLIITVDCGISCANEVDFIKSNGVDIIITDHHEIPEVLPNCIVIDPKLKNQNYPFKNLCGAGVALKLVYALSDFETVKEYITIAAISTVSDIVELKDENRFIVKYGLELYNSFCPKGIKKLVNACNLLKVPNSTEISFRIAPKLNAGGRMGDAETVLKLYLEQDNDVLDELVNKVMDMNTKRQYICNDIFTQAKQQIEKNNDKITFIKGNGWDIGSLGIVCVKIMEITGKPTIILSKDESNKLVGSMRSDGSLHVVNLFKNVEDLLLTFGGHEKAGGLSLDDENYEEFKRRVTEYANESSTSVELKDYNYDFEIEGNNLTPIFAKQLEFLEPTGFGNDKPKILLRVNDEIATSFMKNHNEHIISNIQGISAVGFYKASDYFALNTASQKELLILPFIDIFNKREYFKLEIQNVLINNIKPFNVAYEKALKLKQLCNLNSPLIPNFERINILNKNLTGKTLYITYKENDSEFIDEKIVYYSIGEVPKQNYVLYAPTKFDGFEHFENIVLLEEPLDYSFVSYLNQKYPNAKIFINDSIQINSKLTISLKRTRLLEIYFLIKELSSNAEQNEIFYYERNLKNKVSAEEFILACIIFEELNLIKIMNEKNLFSLQLTNQKNDLNNSVIYNYIKDKYE